MLRKIWQRLSSGSLFQSVDKRQFQHEIDTHRLFLLTSYKRLDPARDELISEVEARASITNFDVWKQEVQTNVGEQVQQICRTLDEILLYPSDKPKASSGEAKRSRPSGLSFAVGGIPSKIEQDPQPIATRPLNQEDVSKAFKDKYGFTLELKSSNVAHREAGDGLYISGEAGVGTVVSFYPGVTYAPAQYRYMPGYPRVELGNPYLISRFDGLIIDGNPWGRGGDSREYWDGMSERERHMHEDILKSLGVKESNWEGSQHQGKTASDKLWQMVGGGKKIDRMIEGAIVERRNPLALAHFANHPAKGEQPNVMICTYDFDLAGGGVELRPYIPNVKCAVDNDIEMQQSGLLWVRKSRDPGLEKRPPQVCTIVLVATRNVCNEELLLNYRYSNSKNRPSWYHSVDEEEDRRRWE